MLAIGVFPALESLLAFGAATEDGSDFVIRISDFRIVQLRFAVLGARFNLRGFYEGGQRSNDT